MIRLDCNDPSIKLTLPDCAHEPTIATLTRPHCPRHALTITAELPSVTLTLDDPLAIEDGVWTLSVASVCGCYTAPVQVVTCRAPTTQATHTATPDTDRSTECCP